MAGRRSNLTSRSRSRHRSRPGAIRLRPVLLGLLLGGGAVALPLPTGAARAGEITATGGPLSLGTQVNGLNGGSCTAGDCAIGGGTRAGANLFHRFSAFDASGAIRSVVFDTQGQRLLVVGVTHPLGSFLDRPISLSSPASLLWLSPGGIQLGGGVSFSNVPQLQLSTATGLRFAGGRFDALSTAAAAVAPLAGDPLPGTAGLLSDPAALEAAGLSRNGDLTLAGGLLTVDRSLLLDAQGGHLLLDGVTVRAAGAAGSIAMTGASVSLRGSHLEASAPSGGGTVLVGGAVAGGPGLRPATTTLVDAASSIRADATGQGKGGTVVVWADGATRVDGAISARGGAAGGDGGFIETSGLRQLAVTSAPDASAPRGKGGTWLLDPYNLLINSAGPDSGVTGLPGGGVSTTNSAVVAAGTINAALNAGTNVALSTGSGGNDYDGNITLTAPISKTAGGDASLSLTANRNINLDQPIRSTAGRLNLNLRPNSENKTTGGIFLNDNLELNGGTVRLDDVNSWTKQSSGTIVNTTIEKTGSEPFYADHAKWRDVTIASSFAIDGDVTLFGATTTLADGVTLRLVSGWDWYVESPVHEIRAAASGSAVLEKQKPITLDLFYAGPSYSLTIGEGLAFKGPGRITGWSKPGNLINNGQIINADPVQPLNINVSTLTNNGTIHAAGGRVNASLDSPSTGLDVFRNAGVLRLSDGGVFDTNNRSIVSANGSEIRFDGRGGSFNLGSGGIISHGAITSADAIASTLTINGYLSLSGDSQVNLQLIPDASMVGSLEADRIHVNGAVSLQGGLRIDTLVPGGPSIGSQFDVLTSTGPIQGSNFGPVGLSLPAGMEGRVVKPPEASLPTYRLVQGMPGPGPGPSCAGFCWTGLGSDSLWSTTANWFNNLVPGAPGGSSDVVYLNKAGGTAISLNDPRTIAALFSDSGNSLSIVSGGSLTISGASQVSNLAGGVAIDGGNLTVNGAGAQVSGLQLRSGSLTGNEHLDGPVTLQGGGNIWSGGAIPVGRVLVSSGATLLLDGGSKSFGNVTLETVAGGRIDWTSGDILTYSNSFGGGSISSGSRALINAGTFNIQGDLTWTHHPTASPVDVTLPFTNTGILVKSAGSSIAWLGDSVVIGGASYRATVDLTNSGMLDIQSGSLLLQGAFNQTGILNLANSSTFIKSGGFINEGKIFGTGTIDVGGATLTNAGLLSPGSGVPGVFGPADTVIINGNLALTPTSELHIGLLGSGSTPAANDKIVVNGHVSLGGLIAATLAPGYTPPAGTTADVLSASSLSGSFAGSDLPTGISGSTVSPPAAPSPAYRLSTASAPASCAGFCWTGLGSDNLWSTAANWFNSAVPGGPGVSGVVYLNRAGGAAISLNDPRTIAALFSDSSNALTIVSGGSLTISGASGVSNLAGGVAIDGGNLTVNGAGAQVSGLQLSSGSLTGNGTVTLQGGGNRWSGGTMEGPTVVVDTGATFTLDGGRKRFNELTLQTQAAAGGAAAGTINWSSGAIETYGSIFNRRIVNNAGIFEIQGDLIWGRELEIGGWDSISTSFNNTGALLKSAGSGEARLGDSVVASGTTYGGPVNLTNNGLVDVQSGSLRLFVDYPGTRSGGEFRASSPGSVLEYTTSGNVRIALTGGARLSGAGTHLVRGNLGIERGGVTATNLVLDGGALHDDGTLILTGPNSAWSGGLISRTAVVVDKGAILTLNGGNKLFGDYATLQTAAGVGVDGGTINWSSGDILSYRTTGDGGPTRQVNNGGTFAIQGDLRWGPADQHSVSASFNNSGTLIKSAGSGTARLGDSVAASGSSYESPVLFSNSGLVDARTGTLRLYSGPTKTSSSGEFRASSAGSAIDFYNGNFGLLDGANLTGDGVNVVSGSYFHVLGNTPTASNLWLTGSEGGAIVGDGTLTIKGQNSRWSGGAITSARIVVDNGATFTLDGGSKAFGDARLETIGPNPLTGASAGRINWTGGDIQTYSNFGGFSSRSVINAGVFDIRGDLTWGHHPSPSFAFDLAVPFSNSGVLIKSAGTGTAKLGDSITIGGTTYSNAVRINNAGLVEAQSGTLRLFAGPTILNGSHTTTSTGEFRASSASSAIDFHSGNFGLASGTRLTGAGANVVSGSYLHIRDNTPTATNLQLRPGGGIVDLGGTLTIQGSGSRWSGGVIAATTIFVDQNATFTLDGASKYFADRATIQTAAPAPGVAGGTVNWTAGDILAYKDSPDPSALRQINNAGTFNIQGNLNWGLAFEYPVATIATTFTNSGTLLKSTGSGTASLGADAAIAGTTYRSSVDLRNSGRLDLQSGALQLLGSLSQSGTINLLDGSLVVAEGGFTNTGTISGTGTIDVGTATLTNAGTLSPGGPGTLGVLTIDGNLDLTPSSQLASDLRGSGSITFGNDEINVWGSANLGGTLNVTLTPGYVPAAGTRASILQARALSGSFSSSNLPPDFSGAIVPQVGGPYYLLTKAAACAGFCWDAGGGSDNRWSTATNWTLDTLPGAADIAYLNLLGGASVLLDNAQTIAALFSDAGNSLSIASGGALTLTGGSSTLDGSLTLLDGGSLTLSPTASATMRGGFHQEGGSLDGAGTLTLQGDANSWQGGTWAGGGSTAVAPGSRLLIGSLDTAANPTLLNGRDLHVGSAGRLELASNLEVQGGTNTLTIAPGARLAFTKGLGGFPALLVHAGRLDLAQAGSLQVESNVQAQLGTTDRAGLLRWTATGPTQIDADASLALYTRPYDADLTSEGVVASLNGPVSVSRGSRLVSTSSGLTITPPGPSALQLDGVLTVNGGTTTLATAAVPNATLGSLNLLDGTLQLQGPLQVNGGFDWSGGTLSGDAMALLATAGTSRVSGGGLRLITVPWTNAAGATLQLDGTGVQAAQGLVNLGTLVFDSQQKPGQGAAFLRLPSGQSLSNAGSLEINSSLSAGGWTLLSDSAAQNGRLENSGSIRLNSGYTAWEVAFSNSSTGVVSLASESVLSVQNGRTLAGRFNLGSGSTLWLSERHGSDSVFSGATLQGPGTVQVLGSGPVVRFDAATTFRGPSGRPADLPALLLGSGGSVVLDGPALWSRFSQSGGALSGSGSLEVQQAFSRSGGSFAPTLSAISINQASGDLEPGALTTAGPLSLRAAAGHLTLSGAMEGSRITALGATGLTLAGGARLEAAAPSGVSIALSSGRGAFRNEAGSAALNPAAAATWQIYTPGPFTSGQTLGGLVPAFKQYGKTIGDGTAVQGSGNGLFHAQTPLLTLSLLGSVSRVYDGTTTALLDPLGLGLQMSGVLPGDAVQLRLPSSRVGSFDTPNAGNGKTVRLAGFGVASASEGAMPVYGYQVAGGSASGAIGSITPAPLTLRAVSESRPYDGSRRSSGQPLISAGRLLGGDTLQGLSQRFASPDALGEGASTLLVNPDYRLLDGNGGANYAVTLESAPGTITPLSIAVLFSTLETPILDPATGTPAYLGQFQGVLAPDRGRVALLLTSAAAGLDPLALEDPASGQANALSSPAGVALVGESAGNYRLERVVVRGAAAADTAEDGRGAAAVAAARERIRSASAPRSGGEGKAESGAAEASTPPAGAAAPLPPAGGVGPGPNPGAALGSGVVQGQAGGVVVTTTTADPETARGGATTREALSGDVARQLSVVLDESQSDVLSPEQVQQLLQRVMQGVRSGEVR